MLVKQALLHVGPKLLESIGRHSSGETFRRAQKRVRRLGFATNAPGVRQEVTSKNRQVPGIGGPEAAVIASGCKSEPSYISDAHFKGLVRHAKVARIFPQEQAGACFNCISRGAAGQTVHGARTRYLASAQVA